MDFLALKSAFAVEMSFGGVCGSGFRQSFRVKGVDDNRKFFASRRVYAA
jgi:hypothetical protein